ncbi:LysR family transcriptional regulator [Paenibacillus qinlingensis]|uniref:DNA-binding transcriptional LysR family regulator n=1 Tax=Paenibacillus qinlingensis TaxID=1837343 RepID=A0ABU1P6G5_9BACL|nr:LysR family transcriptional regulator [Paenibacillus qinlingensis]MDR6555350.1 DNA-binding transcriptional LysR family regulator [Paenibacillus qinlingensis]
MELLQLHYFQIVARLEHMTKAAEELNIAQPSLSKTISRLEEDLGAPLFSRQGRNIRLNQFGKVFLARVERVFRELEEGKREIKDMIGLERGSITLAASLTSILPELLGEFLNLYPNVHIRQVLERTAVIKRMLEDGEIDLSITTTPFEGADMAWTPLRTEEFFVVVPDNHPLVGRESVSLIELKDETFIGLRTGYWFRTLTDSICERAGFIPNTMLEVDEADAVVLLLRKGLGIMFAPELAWQKRAVYMPHRLRITDPGCTVTTGIAWSKKHYLSLAAERFRQFVITYFENIKP